MHENASSESQGFGMATPSALVLLTALVAGAWVPAHAQTVPAPAAPVVAPDTPITTVTVIARLPRRISQEVRGLDRSSASSCAYDFTASREDMIDDYLDSFQGKDRVNDGTESALLMEGETARARRFSDTSPYGDARDSGGPRTVPTGEPTGAMSMDTASNPCRQSDYNIAAARNQIARKDNTLNQAYKAYDTGDYRGALALFRTSYNKVGWDDAALMLGTMYQAGQGTASDPKEAIAWYTRLAGAALKKEHYAKFNPLDPERATPRIEAQLRLAEMYMAGKGVARDPARARAWYKEAEQLDFLPARFTLGQMYAAGYGGAKDMAAAVKLYKAAAEEDYVPAQMALARLYQSGAAVARDPQAAFGWFGHVALSPRAGRHKPFAQYEVARAYDEGVGVKADPERALAFYKAAALAGHPAAQNALATYFYNGQQVAKDLPVARKLFITAASQGQDGAMVNVAAMLVRGEGGLKDPVQALAWLQLAARMGNEQAIKAVPVLAKGMTPAERERANTVLGGAKAP